MGKTLRTAGTAVFLAADNINAQERTYLEIAVYEVADPAVFPAIRTEAAPRIEDQPGFLWWQQLVGDGGLFADVVAWSTPAAAKTAAETIQTHEAFAPFISGISEIRHFAHYWAGVSQELLSQQLEAAPLIEIALYEVKDRATHERSQPDVYERLQGRDGLLGGSHLVRDGAEDGFGDLLTWTDREAFEATGAALTALPELAPFFRGVGETYVFALFWEEKNSAPGS